MCEAGTSSRVTWLASGSISSMSCDAVRDRLRRAAGVLDRERAQQRAFLELLGAEQRADLVRLAAEPDHQHAGEVGVARVAAERAPQDLHALALRVHAAAGAVRQRDDAVDVRISGEALAREVVGDARAQRWPSSSPSTGCRRNCASPPGRRRARCRGTSPARRRTRSGGRRRRTRSRGRTCPSRGCAGARARPVRCRGSRSRSPGCSA